MHSSSVGNKNCVEIYDMACMSFWLTFSNKVLRLSNFSLKTQIIVSSGLKLLNLGFLAQKVAKNFKILNYWKILESKDT